jgi:hypothetical protein
MDLARAALRNMANDPRCVDIRQSHIPLELAEKCNLPYLLGLEKALGMAQCTVGPRYDWAKVAASFAPVSRTS